MDIAALTGAATTTEEQPSAAKSLDKEAFLHLIVAQMQNQNPLEPTSESEYMGQLAQLGTMEQTQLLNDNLLALLGDSGPEALSRAAQLVGRRIEYTDPGTGEILPGIVSAVELKDGAVVLDVGTGEDLPLSSLVRILDGAAQEGV
jgi:flagellar basal-body rod modification protein FlgD